MDNPQVLQRTSFQDPNGDDADKAKHLGFLIGSSIFLGVVVFAFILIMVFLCRRKNHQPLKKRSPNLIILSTIGSFSFCIIMLLQEILYYACILNDTMGTDGLYICKSEPITYLNCFIGLTLLTICEPLTIIPYYLRSLRLYVIFRA